MVCFCGELIDIRGRAVEGRRNSPTHNLPRVMPLDDVIVAWVGYIFIGHYLGVALVIMNVNAGMVRIGRSIGEMHAVVLQNPFQNRSGKIAYRILTEADGRPTRIIRAHHFFVAEHVVAFVAAANCPR